MENVWLRSSNAEKHQALQWITDWWWVKSITQLQTCCTWVRLLSLSQKKKFLSVLGSNKGLVFVSTSCEKHWPCGEGLRGEGGNKKHFRKQELSCEKRLKKMGLFRPGKERWERNHASSHLYKRQKESISKLLPCPSWERQAIMSRNKRNLEGI